MFEISTWLVAVSALIVTIATLTTRRPVDIRIFALGAILQLVTYIAFSVLSIPVEIRQAISRLNIVTTNVLLTIILLGARFNDRK